MTKEARSIEMDHVVVRFAGDSGDGMQLTGTQFSDTAALAGNDLATFPDFPAEIRAPQGTVAGVSGFQVHIGHIEIHTPGDLADVLVVMNPAALKANLNWAKKGGTIIYDLDSFDQKSFIKAGYEGNPLEDDSLSDYNVLAAPITSLTKETLKDSGLDNKSMVRSKNMFALGMVYWLFNRKMTQTEEFLEQKFRGKDNIISANKKVLEAGYYFAETVEALPSNYLVLPADQASGVYRNITGNVATAWGLMAASEKSNTPLFLGSYPITPASDVLHELARHKGMGVKIFQAEDEIAAVCSAIGASFSGSLAATTTSGPGLALKGEAIGLAMITEIPLVIVDIQRGGPSTGLPTKTEQSDLMQALYGRNGESPIIVLAASTPSNCFDYAFMAAKLSLEHMTPVLLLTDGYLGNGAQPWKIPDFDAMPEIKVPIAKLNDDWQPYRRDKDTLARTWAKPGMPGLEHRIGGLEKDALTGNVSYDPINHEEMVNIRAEKVQRVANYIPDLQTDGAGSGDLLVIGWGGAYGSLLTAVNEMSSDGKKVGLSHFHYINPLPKNTAEVLSKFKKIIVCELNTGQFVNHLRAQHPEFEYFQYNKIQGLPFQVAELKDEFTKILKTI